jgi:hypothetical protein
MDAGGWIGVFTILANAAALVVYRWVNNRENKALSDRVTHVEVQERECQEQRKIDREKLLLSLERERMLREALPAQLVEGVKQVSIGMGAMVEEARKHTDQLTAQTGSLRKLELASDSDAQRNITAELEAIKKQMQDQGISIKHIEMVLAGAGAVKTC